MGRVLSQTIAAELRVDETETGFSSFTDTIAAKSSATQADDAGVGTVAWSNVANVASDNDLGATRVLGATTGDPPVTVYSSAVSHYIKATNFSMGVPASTINGIQVTVKRKRNTGTSYTVTDERVRLVKAGTIQTVDKADTSTSWPTSYGSRSYGGSSDLWGGSWTTTDVNDTGFGVAIAADGTGGVTADIDWIAISVTYTVAGAETTVTGTAPVRFGPDESDAGNIPRDVSFQTEIPGGFSAASMVVSRSPLFDPDKLAYASARLYEYETNRTLYEGRVVGVSEAGGDVSFEMEGWAAHLSDDAASPRMIWYDRDLSGWQGMGVQRKLNTVATYQIGDASATPDPATGAPSLETGFSLEAARIALTEGWYDAAGLPIAAIDYAWKKSSTVDNADTDWQWSLSGSTDDLVTSTTWSGSLRAAGPGSGTLTVTGGNKKFATVELKLSDTTHTQGQQYSIFWTLLGVVGSHGLTLRGAVAAPDTGRGLYGSDIVRYCVETWAPLLEIDENNMEATDFVIPHAVDKDPTTAREMIDKYALFGGGDLDYPMDWAVWDGRSFGFVSPGNWTGLVGKTWRTRYDPDGAEAAESGPDVQRLINGCLVKYNDGTADKTVGPPGSGADSTTTELIDITPDNPANRTGANLWEQIDAGVTTLAGATQIGKMVMAERNRQQWRGEVQVKEWVLDENGHEFPAACIRAGSSLVIEDDEDTRPRRVVQTSYDSNTETVSCSIGASPDRLDTLLARLSVVLEGRLS